MNNKQNKSARKSFYVIVLLLPFLILGLVEGLLRLSGFGQTYPLFIPAPNANYLYPNPDVIKRYFSNPDFAPSISPDTSYFRAQKSPNSFRIVVQGGSSAAGFPYGRFGSLSGMLEQRFKRQYPDKEIEIINTAMSAVNSYTLLDLTDDILAIEPDLVLIYAGHNEFLGIMGVGSTLAARGGRSASLMYLQFRELRLFQLMQQVFLLFQDKPDVSQSNDRTLMAKVAAGQTIPFNSELFEEGLEQFSGNLDLILAKYKAEQIPVVLGTLASNEKDQPPFASGTESTNADAFYQAGFTAYLQRNYAKALESFQAARDYDQLRFRAPSSFNDIIRSKVDSELVHLADSESRIRKDEQSGVIGYDHMLEHLHPNVRGYFLLAEAFADVISEQQFLDQPALSIPITLAWKDVPLTEVDQLVAMEKIRQLTSDYPFKESQRSVMPSPKNDFNYQMAVKRLEGGEWLETMEEMLTQYQRQDKFAEAAKVAAIMFDAIPEQHQIAYIAGQLYFKINDLPMALYYHKKALALDSQNVNYILMTARSYYMNRDLVSSIRLLEQAVNLAPNNQQAKFQLQRIKSELTNG